MIYFAWDAQHNQIKIGYTKSETTLLNRLHHIKSVYKLNLTLLCVCDGEKGYESEIHELFMDDNIHGEWFNASDDLITFMDMVDDPLMILDSRYSIGRSVVLWLRYQRMSRFYQNDALQSNPRLQASTEVRSFMVDTHLDLMKFT